MCVKWFSSFYKYNTFPVKGKQTRYHKSDNFLESMKLTEIFEHGFS